MQNNSLNNVLLTPHFSLLEMTESRTAKKNGIDNTPPPEVVENLKALCLGTLEPLREALQMPVVITNGFRCQRLNEILLHSARKSQHLSGCAADFYVGWAAALNGKGKSGDAPSPRKRLVKAFRLIILNEAIDYDQLIIYPTFIHVSYVSRDKNRHSIMEAKGNGKYRSLTKADALSLT